MAQTLVTGAHVSFGYNKESICRCDLLQIEAQTFNLLLGGNGAGKSTILKTLARELPVLEGTIQYLKNFSVCCSEYIGFVPQRVKIPRPLPLTTFEFVMLGATRLCTSSRASYPQSSITKALQLLDDLGLKAQIDMRVEKLSIGQLQRATIVRELVGDPLLLLLDESTAGVDQTFQPIVFEVLNQAKQHTAIVLATHDLHHLHTPIDWVYTVDHGVLTQSTFAEARCC